MKLKNIFYSLIPDFILRGAHSVIELRDLVLHHQTSLLQISHQNPLNRFGKQCFSQTDEDGITLEILRRLNCIEQGTFVEFGVGNETENNTLILKTLGWRGFWVGGEDLAFNIGQPKEVFSYYKKWITLDNVDALMEVGKKDLGVSQADVISLDLDGNDIYFVEKLLAAGNSPKLFMVEYNAKFPPQVKWQINYNPEHIWQGDDYFGASLSSFCDIFSRYSYRLICCNSASGANAFFIKEELMEKFSDVPNDIDAIYVPPRYFVNRKFGHKTSPKTIANLFL
jgi:hypothetical protein